MALNLEELKFVVDTTELDAAAKKIGALGDALNKVNKPTKQAALDAEKLAQAQAKTAEANAKAQIAAEKAATAAERLGKAQDGATESSKKGMTILERQTAILENMAKGYSRGDASILATAKAMGVANEELAKIGETRQAQRALIGADPFDKSQGAIQAWTNKLKTASEMDKLYAQGLGLTKTQLKELAIEKQRLITLAEMEGKSLKDVEIEYKKLISIAAALAQQENVLTTSLRNKDKALSDSAKAAAYVADADARLAAALDVSNAKLDKGASDALVKYEKNLRLMGLSSEETAAKLAKAKTQFDAIADKKQADKLQYLARAISVQMGDVGISLASGMNPLLVMIQQGDQIRGAVQQAGASGKELEKAMANAATQIATSFLQTGQAIGGFFVNAVKSATAAVFGFPFSLMKDGFLSIFAGADVSAKAFERLTIAASAFGKTGILVILTTLVALGVEYVKVANAQKELTIALATNGAGLGMSSKEAQGLAESMKAVGVNTLDAMRMLGEFANTGANAAIPLETIVKSAKDMEKFVGIASKDTMKAFSDISEKPVEGLIKLAKTTGNVSAATILQADAFVRAGKQAEAAKLAQEALAESNTMVVNTVKNSLDPLQTLWIDIKSAISSASQAVYDLLKSETVVNIFRTAWETVAVVVSEVWYVLKQTGTEIAGIGSQIMAVMRGDFAGAAAIGEKMTADADIARKAQDDLVASILDRNKATKENITLTDEQRKANKAAAKEIENNLAKRQAGGGFTSPKDNLLETLKTDYANAVKQIDSESNKLIAENKNRFALGLLDTGEYLSEELKLISSQNNQKLAENTKYLEKLEDARSKQEAKIRAEGARAIAAGGIEKSEAEAKKMKEALDALNTAYNNLTESVKTNNEVLADKAVEQQIRALDALGQFTKKVTEGSKEFIRTQDDLAAKRRLQLQLEQQLAGLSGADLARVKARIDTEQSHIDKLSELQSAALKAAAALSELSLSGLDPSDAKYKDAERAVLAANNALEQAKNTSRQQIVQAGIDAEMLYYMQEYNKLKSSIADAISTALFEGGKEGGKKLRNLLEAELRKPITVFVNAVVNSLMGNTTGASGGNLLGNIGSSLMSKAAGSISIGGGSLAAAGEAFGTGFMTTLQGGSVAEAAAAYGSAGMSGVSTGLTAGAQVATAIPYVAAALLVANALGVFRTTKQVGGGILGVLGEGDISSYATMRKSGTLFRGPSYFREDRGEFSGSDALQASFAELKASTATMAEAVGVSSDAVKAFTKKIEISFDGLTNEQIQEKISATFKGVGDELAALVLGAGATAEQLSSLYNNIMQQRYDLETQLLELQGDTVALRERERAKIYETNRALFDQIKALEDKKAADEAAAESLQKLTSITSGIVDEINRLRGINTSQTGLEAQFAILTAQARAGDMTALANLPAITQGLEQIAGATAVNATDIVLARARLAQSLQDTLGYVGASGFTASPSAASVMPLSSVSAVGTGATATVSATSSNQELLSALVTEVQGLRAEVRADVSHNAKTAKILERANQDGETLSVSATIDGGVV